MTSVVAKPKVSIFDDCWLAGRIGHSAYRVELAPDGDNHDYRSAVIDLIGVDTAAQRRGTGISGQHLAVNHDHVYRFLVNRYKSLYKPKGATFYDGVSELGPATVLHIAPNGKQRGERYWHPECQVDEQMSLEDAVEETRRRLIRSVELRLRADVPIAFCMSGGVDSNSLISIAKNVFDYDVHGFTIVNTDARYEEQDIIERSAAELGIRHTNIATDTRDFLPRLCTLVQYHDAPVYTITYFAHWLLMEAVAQHGYRISVSGTAAGELFTGYFDHHLLYLAEIRHNEQLYERARSAWLKHIRPIVRNPHLQNPDLFVENPNFRDHSYLHADRFASRLKQFWHEPFSESRYSDRLLRNRMLNELFHESTPVILHEEDLNGMYYSIENRTPFLDRDLFEFCYRIPTKHLIRDGVAKAMLRDAVRGIVSDCVVNNPRRVGFNVPIDSFNVKDPDVRASLLDQSLIFEHVRREAIDKLIRQPQLLNSDSKFLFNFLTCKMFLEESSHRQLIDGRSTGLSNCGTERVA